MNDIKKKTTNNVSPHIFGGKWTQTKLAVIHEYFTAYFKVMKKQSFKLVYIDAFAGTGTRFSSNKEDQQTGLFRDEESDTDSIELKTGFFDGSAKIAIELDEPFHHYYFIESDINRLEALKNNIAKLDSNDIRKSFIPGDANLKIEEIIDKLNWKTTRGIIFLDPYGVSVYFDTLSKLAKMSNFDMWCLFPVGTIKRLLPNNYSKYNKKYDTRLNSLFGTDEWADRFYGKDNQTQLFSSDN